MSSLILRLLPLSLLVTSAFASQRSFYTRPDVHGDQVVFTCEGDLWLGNLKTGEAKRLTSDPGVETGAHFSPDGTQIAFTASYEGPVDVYVMPVTGDAPRRVTFSPGSVSVLGWTPDGKNIIYRSLKGVAVGSSRSLFEVPAAGGQSTKLPVPEGEFASLGMNGELAYVPVSNEWANWFRYRAGAKDSIWLTDLKGSFKKLISSPAVDTTPVWAGDNLFFVSERSGVFNLYSHTSTGDHQITHYTDAPVRYPGSDGRKVVYQHGPGLAVYDIETQKVTELDFQLGSDRVHDRPIRVPLVANLGSVSLGPTGKRVLVESRGQVVSVAATEGDMRVLENTPGTRARFPVWAPDGKKIAFVSDRSGENEIWVSDASTGSGATQLTHGMKAVPFSLKYSPDGNYLAFNDRDMRTVLVDAHTGVIRVVDQSPNGGSYDNSMPFTFSPDSKYIAYGYILPSWIAQVRIAPVAGGKPVEVTDPAVNSHDPGFSADGKYLAFLADTHFAPAMSNLSHKYAYDNEVEVYLVPLSKSTPSPFLPKSDEEIAEVASAAPAGAKPEAASLDADGIRDRVIRVPLEPGRYQHVDGVAGRLLVLNLSDNPPMGGSPAGLGQLVAFDLEHKSSTPIQSDLDEFSLSNDRKKILLKHGSGIQVVDAGTGPTNAGSGAVKLNSYSVVVEPEKEWRQIFEESWRLGRDLFYDPATHGVDWNAVKKTYEARLALIGDRSDLTRLLADMISELNAGHCYVGGPSPFAQRNVPMGFLGADYEAVPGAAAVRIKKLYRGDPFSVSLRSPFLEPGIDVHEGDYIVAVAGQPVKPDQDIQSLLIGTVGQTIAVSVNSTPSLSGARIVRVSPLPSEAVLRYQDWVQQKIAYVHKYGGENFGYTHFSNMEADGVIGFTKGQIPNVDKQAMIYDDRFNGGGFVSSLLLENIAAKPIAWWKPRYGGTWTREDWANLGYKVALCNEFDFSDGELFVETWKRMNIGPVIGHTTGGGEVGSGGGFGLIDGGSIYIPNYGAFADGKWLVEGEGAKPDIEVDQDPTAVLAGRDPQLDRAIEYLKQKLAKAPIKKPEHPAFPNKALKLKQ